MMQSRISFSKIRLTEITMCVGIMMVAWQNMISPLSGLFQNVFFVLAIFMLGIPHGALDHLVQQETAKRRGELFHLLRFLINYLVLMAFYALTWYILPQFSLVVFILMSCWHFAETDIHNIFKQTVLSYLVKLSYGTAVLGWLLFSHKLEAGEILQRIVPVTSIFFQSWLFAALHSILILWICAAIILTLLTLQIFIRPNNSHWWQIIQLIVILLCSFLLPLLPAFALYFAGWHSVVTLYNINKFIEGASTFNKQILIKNLWFKAIPFSIVAICGLVLTGYLLRHYAPLFDPAAFAVCFFITDHFTAFAGYAQAKKLRTSLANNMPAHYCFF